MNHKKNWQKVEQNVQIIFLGYKILIEKYGWFENLHVNGWKFFTQDGITLSNLGDRI